MRSIDRLDSTEIDKLEFKSDVCGQAWVNCGICNAKFTENLAVLALNSLAWTFVCLWVGAMNIFRRKLVAFDARACLTSNLAC